jgi:hypothetical protein
MLVAKQACEVNGFHAKRYANICSHVFYAGALRRSYVHRTISFKGLYTQFNLTLLVFYIKTFYIVPPDTR